MRYFWSVGLNALLNISFGMHAKDNKSGFILARKEVLTDIFHHTASYKYFQTPLRWLGIAAILVCLPAKLHLNPFSLPNAEQELLRPHGRVRWPELAMWELSHGLEWAAATGWCPR